MAELPTLKKGSKGDAVKGLQNALNVRHGFVNVDGDFSSKTESAVKQFQQASHLVADGVVGSKTWSALDVYMVQSGDTLSGIAEERLGDASRWQELFEANRALISDPDKISPGQVLVLPGSVTS